MNCTDTTEQCPACLGSGYEGTGRGGESDGDCSRCDGSGRVEKPKPLTCDACGALCDPNDYYVHPPTHRIACSKGCISRLVTAQDPTVPK